MNATNDDLPADLRNREVIFRVRVAPLVGHDREFDGEPLEYVIIKRDEAASGIIVYGDHGYGFEPTNQLRGLVRMLLQISERPDLRIEIAELSSLVACCRTLFPDNGVGEPYIFVDVCHTYGCPSARIGRKHGPCNCGGDALKAHVEATRAALYTRRDHVEAVEGGI